VAVNQNQNQQQEFDPTDPSQVQSRINEMRNTINQLWKKINEMLNAQLNPEKEQEQTKETEEKSSDYVDNQLYESVVRELNSQKATIEFYKKQLETAQRMIEKLTTELATVNAKGEPVTRTVKEVELPPVLKIPKDHYTGIYETALKMLASIYATLDIMFESETALDFSRYASAVRYLTETYLRLLDVLTYQRIQVTGVPGWLTASET